MQTYFSHSYRDVAINSHFLELFVEEEVELHADQKTDVWCMAKLERYMGETAGFVSVIPRRETEEDSGGYSPYIGQELNLARRARVPRLLFVDEVVLKHHRLDFPEDAVPFRGDALAVDRALHVRTIRDFGLAVETSPRPRREAVSGWVTVVAIGGRVLRAAAQDVAEILQRERFSVTLLLEPRPGRGLDDIRLLETLRRAELCVFVHGARLSETQIALAMARADCIPSIRLRHDPRTTDTNPSVHGEIRWNTVGDMLVEFGQQLASYQRGLVRPVELARRSSAAEAVRSMGTMDWVGREENNWAVENGPALLRHVHPDFSFVRDEVDRVRAQVRRALGLIAGREDTRELCQLLYDGVRRHRLGYETEQRSGITGVQRIRTPKQIAAHKTATCIDAVCLFASLLECAGQNPLIVIIRGDGFAHALAGYRVRGEPSWDNRTFGDLRGAVARRDAVLFEATGAVEADEPVGAETAAERRGKLLDFSDSTLAAARLLERSDVVLKHFVDVRQLRDADPQEL